MKKRLFLVFLVLTAAPVVMSCHSERVTAESYEDRDLEAPYGSVIEDRDYSEQAGVIQGIGRKAADAASGVADRLSEYGDTAGEVLDAAGDVPDTVRAGADKVSSLAERVTDLVNNLP